VPTTPFIDINMNFIEGLPKSNEKEVIFMIVDRFNKYAHLMTLAHPYSGITVAKSLMENVYKLHGISAMIVSNKDNIFLGQF